MNSPFPLLKRFSPFKVDIWIMSIWRKISCLNNLRKSKTWDRPDQDFIDVAYCLDRRVSSDLLSS